MAFQPEKITRDDVLKAAMTIDREEMSLRPSTKYDVIIEGKAYPPKDLMRLAHENATGEYLWERSGGPPTNKFLTDLGFEITEKGTKSPTTEKTSNDYYVAGALWGGENDQLPRFIQEGIWEDGHGGKNATLILAIKPGSRIAIKAVHTQSKVNSVMTIKQRGEVLENDNDGEGLKVQWEENFKPFTVPFSGGYWKSIHHITNPEHIKAIFDHRSSTVMKNKMKEKYPLNQILFGPPGTGKTYHTINKALEIIGEDIEDKSRAEIKELYDARIDSGQIVFTTFHQSLGYEDFIEGIKPIEPEREGDPVNYRVELGIFRNLCIEASFAIAQQRESRTTEQVLDFSILYDQFSETIEEKLLNGQIVELETKAGGSVLVEGISQQGNFVIKHHEGTRTYTVSKARLTKLQAAIKNLDDVNNINDQFRAIIGGSNSSAYWSVLNAIRREKPITKRQTEHRSYTFEEKREVVLSLSPDDYIIEDRNAIKNYVLIIDEINRGNISQIFGELITLVEENKRLGKDEALTTVLPYSKQKFGVPANLYIIGTMNTADRSVEALDTALRRRFDFSEMLPKPALLNSKRMILNLLNKPQYNAMPWDEEPFRSHADALYNMIGINNKYEEAYYSSVNEEPVCWEMRHLKGISPEDFTGINFELLLETINKRIEKLIDKDHCIGHSYFLNLTENENPEEELRNIFQNKIIPLLQEYFFGDLGKIELVIGERFFEKPLVQIDPSKFFAKSSYEDKELLAERKVYKIKNVKDPEFDIKTAVKEIYHS